MGCVRVRAGDELAVLAVLEVVLVLAVPRHLR